ncbi:MAG: cytochrome c oxidase subunit 3 [Fimbriimonadales bacterium]
MDKTKLSGDDLPESAITGNGHGSGLSPDQDGSFSAARLGMWLAVGALSMVFAALAVAYVARLHDKPNFFFEAPSSLWASTVILVFSSFTLHLSVAAIRKGEQKRFRQFLAITVVLGWLFIVSQLFAWFQLMSSGFYAQTNPFSGFFYILTFVHAAHLIVGIVWISYLHRVAVANVFTAKRHLAVDLGALYWHFVDVAWIVLFVLLMFF